MQRQSIFSKFFRKKRAPEQKFQVELEHDDLIHGLRQYVRLNKAIPAFYTQIEKDITHQENLDALLFAIKTADFSAEIFSHKDCFNYLLYLIENKRVPFWVGMSAYNYLTALAQFTDSQQLRVGDEDVEARRLLVMQKLVEGGKLTAEGKDYIKGVIIDIKVQTGVVIEYAEMCQYVLDMPAFEQHIMCVQLITPIDDFSSETDKLLNVLKHNMAVCHTGGGDWVGIPSYGIFKFYLQQLSPAPIQIKPILGNIKESTRDALHAQDQHPVSIYSPSIRSNIPTVHGYRAGPIPNMLHDMGHVYWATLLGNKNREFIVRQLVPFLDRVIAKTKMMFGEQTATNPFDRFKEAIQDYDLSPIDFYWKKDLRLSAYLGHFVEKGMGINPFNTDLIRKVLLVELRNWIATSMSKKELAEFIPSLMNMFEAINIKLVLAEEMLLLVVNHVRTVPTTIISNAAPSDVSSKNISNKPKGRGDKAKEKKPRAQKPDIAFPEKFHFNHKKDDKDGPGPSSGVGQNRRILN